VRVAFISSILGYPWGGPDRLWTEAASFMQSRGDKVFIGVAPLTADHESVRRLQSAGAELFLRRENSVYRGRRRGMERKAPVLRGKYLESRLSKFEPDLVVLTQGGTFDFTAEHHLIEWLEESGAPFVLVCHQGGDCPPATKSRDQLVRVFSRAAATCFVSSANRAAAEHQMRFTIPRASIIQNPLAWTRAEPLPWPEGKMDGPAVLFALGRMDVWQKGWDVFLAAAAEAARDHDFVIRLAGRGPDAELISEYGDHYGLSARISVREFLPSAELEDFWAGGELFLLPSRAEGCASTMLEAMMCGRPVLATKVGGVHDWLEDGESAFLASTASVEDLAACLQRALEARGRWKEMGLAVRAAFDRLRDRDPLGSFVRLLDEAVARGGK
jgi:L-malate glycosyltransferase